MKTKEEKYWNDRKYDEMLLIVMIFMIGLVGGLLTAMIIF